MAAERTVEPRDRERERLAGTTDEIRLAPWFGFVRSLHESGIYEALIDRCWQTNHLATVNACEAAIEELERIEHRQAKAIIRGEMSKTLWQRTEH